ncbi:MAG: hypothetical protein E7620_08400 [Ruminococcaceae bacterium]|nr:hypothetical protein [Oscillospiraceae bacterium]
MNEEEKEPTPTEEDSPAPEKEDEAEQENQTTECKANKDANAAETPAESVAPSPSVSADPAGEDNASSEPQERRISLKLGLLALCCFLVVSILTTYLVTSALWRKDYLARLQEKQDVIDSLSGEISQAASNLQMLEAVIDLYSYYANTMDREAMLEAAFQAYVAASGDRYARYYTEEEYLQLVEENNAEYCGIGISVVNTEITVGEGSQLVFQIIEIHEGSSAANADLRVGDYIYAVESNGALETVDSLGYNGAVALIRGEAGSSVRIGVYRESNGGYATHEQTLIRGHYEALSVRGELAENHPEVGIVSISSFDLKTPQQLKQVVNGMIAEGVAYFVFDVRGNPGGDLQSIKAVLSYFLREGDLVLSAIDKNENVVHSYLVEPTSFSGDYAACSVLKSEIGMYRNLNMVVLCDKGTASAAEVFTATMQDYQLAPVVGVTTFGKGIMQSTRRIPFEGIVGYIKLTTYAYKTNRADSYHDIGIQPDTYVELSEEAKKQPLVILPQSQDAQLQTAINLLISKK